MVTNHMVEFNYEMRSQKWNRTQKLILFLYHQFEPCDRLRLMFETQFLRFIP